MDFPGFVGPSYKSISQTASGDRCVNLFPEKVENSDAWMLINVPGYSLRHDLGNGTPVRGMCFVLGRCFVAVGTALYEIFKSEATTPVNRGTIAASDNPVTMACNGVQLMVVSGSSGYILTLATNAFAQIAGGFPGATMCGVIDNFFIVNAPSTRKIYISTLMDGLTWGLLDYGVKEGDPENISSIFVDHREIAIFGPKNTEIWYDSGDADFPLSRRSDVAIEEGIAAPFSPVRLDNSFFWLSTSERGGVMARRMQGYTPMRVSDHAVENEWRTYGDISDAVGYSYEENGHAFWILFFPTAKKTWAYDAATQSWHERARVNPVSGEYEAHRGRCHCNAWGAHLIGDRIDGKIYTQSLDTYAFNNEPRTWLRSKSFTSQENKRIFFGRFEILMEPGVGLSSGQGSNPTVIRRISNDSGYTWSSEQTASIGATGEHLKRCYWNLGGSGRRRVEEISGSDPVKTIILNASYDSVKVK